MVGEEKQKYEPSNNLDTPEEMKLAVYEEEEEEEEDEEEEEKEEEG